MRPETVPMVSATHPMAALAGGLQRFDYQPRLLGK